MNNITKSVYEKFLDAFRALDSELKDQSSTVLDFENSLKDGSTEKEKLKVCRIMRNYMAHNDTTFLTASNEQIKFLDAQTAEILKRAHLVKDEVKRVKEIKSTEPIKNVIAALDKFPIAPIFDKKGIYLVDKDILIHQLAAGAKKIVLPAKLPKYNYVGKMEKIDSLSSGNYIVTDNGTSTGKYLGLLVI